MKRWIPKRMWAAVVRGLLVAGLAWGTHSAHRVLDSDRQIRFVSLDPVFLPRGEVLKMVSMGYRGLVADALWIQTVLYYGRRIMDEDNPYYTYAMEKGRLRQELADAGIEPVSGPGAETGRDSTAPNRDLIRYVYPMLDRVTTLDPHFVFPYLYGGIYVLMDTGDIRQSKALLEKGYAANPGRWEFPFYLGWIAWYYLKEPAKTLEWLKEAVQRENCPSYVVQMLVGLTRSMDQVDMTRWYLEGLRQTTDNEQVRERIQAVLDDLNRDRPDSGDPNSRRPG